MSIGSALKVPSLVSKAEVDGGQWLAELSFFEWAVVGVALLPGAGGAWLVTFVPAEELCVRTSFCAIQIARANNSGVIDG
jgi:hypothetical protein